MSSQSKFQKLTSTQLSQVKGGRGREVGVGTLNTVREEVTGNS